MTDSEILRLQEQARRDYERAAQELAAQEYKVGAIADGLERLAKALHEHPHLVTGTPPIDHPDYRQELNLLDRQIVTSACDDLRELQEKARVSAKRLRNLQVGSPQSLIE